MVGKLSKPTHFTGIDASRCLQQDNKHEQQVEHVERSQERLSEKSPRKHLKSNKVDNSFTITETISHIAGSPLFTNSCLMNVFIHFFQ